jgi:hypothetical protein
MGIHCTGKCSPPLNSCRLDLSKHAESRWWDLRIALARPLAPLRSFSDAYAGKKAKLVDAQLRNKNGAWLKYGAADFNFTSIDNDTIAWPESPDKDWSKFSIVNLGGNKTWPMPTAAFAASNIDLRDKGAASL